MRENGLRAADQPAREVDVTVEMQRKVQHAEFLISLCFRQFCGTCIIMDHLMPLQARNQELDVKRNGIGLNDCNVW